MRRTSCDGHACQQDRAHVVLILTTSDTQEHLAGMARPKHSLECATAALGKY